MKRKAIAIIILSIILIVLFSPTGILFRRGRFRLSLMSDERLAVFLEENNVRVPKLMNDPESNKRLIRRIVCMVEKDPDYRIVIEYTPSYVFQNNIKDAVNNYYGITDRFSEWLPEVEY